MSTNVANNLYLLHILIFLIIHSVFFFVYIIYFINLNFQKIIYQNYCNIEFTPDQFTQYLLSPEIGFSKVEVIGTPQHRAKGFQRCIQVFTKPGSTPSTSTTPASRSTSSQVRYTPYSQRMCVRRPVYTALTVSSHEMDEDVSLSPRQNDFPGTSTATSTTSTTGEAPKTKFSPSSAEPCGTRLDITEGNRQEAETDTVSANASGSCKKIEDIVE